jgi:hypothetical protein
MVWPKGDLVSDDVEDGVFLLLRYIFIGHGFILSSLLTEGRRESGD